MMIGVTSKRTVDGWSQRVVAAKVALLSASTGLLDIVMSVVIGCVIIIGDQLLRIARSVVAVVYLAQDRRAEEQNFIQRSLHTNHSRPQRRSVCNMWNSVWRVEATLLPMTLTKHSHRFGFVCFPKALTKVRQGG